MLNPSTTGGSLSPVRALTKADAAYLELRAEILDGVLEPSSPLNQETLAARLGLSTTPLRDALRRLEGDGLVELRTHSLVIVSPLTERELDELYSVRLTLDPMAAALAAQLASEEDNQAIQALAKRPVASDVRTQLASHREFHHRVYAASHHRVLADILDQLWARTDRYRVVLVRDKALDRDTEREHEEIAAAIRDRDECAVSQVVQRHVEAALRAVQQVLAMGGS